MNFTDFFAFDIDAERFFANALEMLDNMKEEVDAQWKEWEQAQRDGDLEKEFNIGEGASDLSDRHLGALLAVDLLAMQCGYVIEEKDGRHRLEKLPDDKDLKTAAIAGELMRNSMFTGYPRKLKDEVIPALIECMKGE